MNREEVLAIPPEVANRLIAEKWMSNKIEYHLEPIWMEGVTKDGQDGWDGFFCPRCNCPESMYKIKSCCKDYYHNLTDAMEALEKFDEVYMDKGMNGWCVSNEWDSNSYGIATGTDESLPAAICQCILLYMNEKGMLE